MRCCAGSVKHSSGLSSLGEWKRCSSAAQTSESLWVPARGHMVGRSHLLQARYPTLHVWRDAGLSGHAKRATGGGRDLAG
eukprot:scaffold38584_cov31-Tisochrysis_lutea.AAC.2